MLAALAAVSTVVQYSTLYNSRASAPHVDVYTVVRISHVDVYVLVGGGCVSLIRDELQDGDRGGYVFYTHLHVNTVVPRILGDVTAGRRRGGGSLTDATHRYPSGA